MEETAGWLRLLTYPVRIRSCRPAAALGQVTSLKSSSVAPMARELALAGAQLLPPARAA